LHHSLTILGSGYTAKFLQPLAEQHYTKVFATSRDPDRHLAGLRADQRIRFDLTQPETWQLIPSATDLLWCFPAVPIELVRQFAEAAGLRTRRLVVLGSTSAYGDRPSTEYPPAWVDETAAIDGTQPRVQGEELLRTSYKAIALRVSGIYGPHRNPIDWIRTGRVARSRKFVNLIHVKDLAAACLAALRQGEEGTIYNVSDGTPRTWDEICQTVERRWAVRSSVSPEPQPMGKRIANQRMRELLKRDGGSQRHEDLYQALAEIQEASLNAAEPSR
jgi:nucleoside-diphosphate-sugar epimerase